MDASPRLPEKGALQTPVDSSFEKFDRSSGVMEVIPSSESKWMYLYRYFTTRQGWLGDYV